jgi:hypothetical protein
MYNMAREFAEHDSQFVFVYTREAHPSERYAGHSSLEQKIEAARTMAGRLGFERTMFVDDLDGTIPQRPNDDVQFVKDLFELGRERPVVEFITAMEHVNGAAATRNIKAWW